MCDGEGRVFDCGEGGFTVEEVMEVRIRSRLVTVKRLTRPVSERLLLLVSNHFQRRFIRHETFLTRFRVPHKPLLANHSPQNQDDVYVTPISEIDEGKGFVQKKVKVTPPSTPTPMEITPTPQKKPAEKAGHPSHYLRCIHLGCQKFFDPLEPPKCVHHVKPPVFHETAKWWSCCPGKKAYDWEGFQVRMYSCYGREGGRECF